MAIKRKDMVELRRSARLLLRNAESAYDAANEQFNEVHRLTSALRIVKAGAKGPLAEACESVGNKLHEHHSQHWTGADRLRDELRTLCDFLGVR